MIIIINRFFQFLKIEKFISYNKRSIYAIKLFRLKQTIKKFNQQNLTKIKI